VHYHFPSKTDLGVALIQRFRTRYQLWMEDAEALPVWEQLRGYFQIHRRFLDQGRVCPGGAIQSELGAIPEEMQGEVRAMVADIQRWLASILDAGRKSGELDFPGTPSAKAAVIAGTIQGVLQTARTLGKSHFDEAVAQLELELRVDADQKLRRGARP
jgi:AcrR family transcriptional regulator